MKDSKKKKDFVEREWNEEIKGEYDDDGFFITPNGSFWDPDEVYFNREGFDKHGGYYDDNGEYIPGKGWDDENNCYESEKEDEYDEYYEDDEFNNKNIKDEIDFKEVNDFDIIEDDIFDGDIMDPNDPNIQQIIKESIPNSDVKEDKQEKKNEETKENLDKEKENKESKEEKEDKMIMRKRIRIIQRKKIISKKEK